MGSSANTMYASMNSERFWNFGLVMATLLGLGADALHPVVQNKAHQQNDQEIDQRERSGGPQVKLAHSLLREELRQEGGGIARAATGEHKGLGVDHETVHEAQQIGRAS